MLIWKIDKVPLPEVLRDVYEYVSPPRTLSLLKVVLVNKGWTKNVKKLCSSLFSSSKPQLITEIIYKLRASQKFEWLYCSPRLGKQALKFSDIVFLPFNINNLPERWGSLPHPRSDLH